LLCVAISGIAAVSLVHAQAISMTPEQFVWTESIAGAVETATVVGDPRKREPFVMRVRFKPDMTFMPHSHPEDLQVTMLSGTLLYAEGERFDETKLKEYPAGSFFVIRANVPHYERAKTAVLFQLSGIGPQASTFLNPKDDPWNKQ
jgi:quercetin dioxygenase-like cupin family protein